MKRREFTKQLCLGTAAGMVAPGTIAKAAQTAAQKANQQANPNGKRPNLLYIFPDQYRIQSLGIWRQPGFENLLRGVTDPVHTPNLDRLAKQGALFNQACSTFPLCSPHRAMLMSSMYPRQNGVENMNCKSGRETGLHNHITCLTDVLADAGYETAYVGKCHWERTEPLFDKQNNYVGTTAPPGGNYANNYDTYIPPGRGRHGNKVWFQNVRDIHHDALSYSNKPRWVANKKDGMAHEHERFTPKLEADVIIDYLKNSNNLRDTSKPFSLVWAPNPPHNPYTDPDRDADRAIYDKYYADMPMNEVLNRPNNQPSDRNNSKDAGRVYFSLVTSIDQQVGRVLDALEAAGEADNTIVVFTSDHGEMMGSQGLMGKGTIHDESFLVPFMMRHPGVIQPRAEDLLLGTVDIMPTLLGMMGLSDQIPETARGRNYARGIQTGDHSAQPKPSSAVYIGGRDKRGVRTDRYTYCISKKNKTSFVYDNVEDPYQLKPLRPDQIPKQAMQSMRTDLGQWLQTADDRWFDAKTAADEIVYPAAAT